MSCKHVPSELSKADKTTKTWEKLTFEITKNHRHRRIISLTTYSNLANPLVLPTISKCDSQNKRADAFELR